MFGGLFRFSPVSSLPTVLLDNLSLRVQRHTMGLEIQSRRRPSRAHRRHQDSSSLSKVKPSSVEI
jgi:hypothetical protein